MKIVNFNPSWCQMVKTHARSRQLTRLGVVDVKTVIASHNDEQTQVMQTYASRGYRVAA